LVNQQIIGYDLETGKKFDIGEHEGPVKDVYWVEDEKLLCTLSFDKSLKLWDLKSKTPAASYDLGKKIYCSDLNYPGLLVGLSDEHLWLLNFKELDQ